jgi:hypothetical protein
MLRLPARSVAVITPYASRPTSNLTFTVALLNQRDLPIPTDLAAALNARGIEVSSI